MNAQELAQVVLEETKPKGIDKIQFNQDIDQKVSALMSAMWDEIKSLPTRKFTNLDDMFKDVSAVGDLAKSAIALREARLL